MTRIVAFYSGLELNRMRKHKKKSGAFLYICDYFWLKMFHQGQITLQEVGSFIVSLSGSCYQTICLVCKIRSTTVYYIQY